MGATVGLILLAVLCACVGRATGACRHVKNDDMIEYSCIGGELSDLDHLPESTGKIRISNMPISRITADTFSRFGSELWVLGCSQCGIADIEPASFQRLENLQQLSLDSNELTTIKESWFKGLEYLTFLDLNYNKIQSIEDGVFENLPNLVDLRLSGNRLECLNLEAVSHLAELKRIFLSENSEFKCPNAVSTFLENRGVSFEKDPEWAKLPADLIAVEIPWEYDDDDVDDDDDGGDGGGDATRDWRTTSTPVPPTPAYRERLHLPPITTTPPARPEIPYRPPIAYTTEKIFYPDIYSTTNWETGDYDYDRITGVQSPTTTPRSVYDDSRTNFPYVPPRTVGPVDDVTPTTMEITTMTPWPRDPYTYYPPYRNEDRYQEQARYTTTTRPPFLAPSPTDHREMPPFVEPNMERTTVPYQDYWTDENVVRPPPQTPGTSPEIYQPASPDDFYQVPYEEPTVTVHPLSRGNYPQRQNEATPAPTLAPVETSTTDKPLPICPTTNSSSSFQRSFETIVIVLLLLVTRDVFVERF